MLEGPLVFVDIDTQRDFLEESGALYVPDSRSILANLERLSRFAAGRGIPILATACCHSADDPELSQFPPHCMAGTDGQRRVEATARPDSVVLGAGDRLEGPLPGHLTLEKQDFDVFSRPDADELIARYNEGQPTFVVYGVATDYCVRAAVEGLLARGCRVAVVVDAVRAIDPDAEAALLTTGPGATPCSSMTDVVCTRRRPGRCRALAEGVPYRRRRPRRTGVSRTCMTGIATNFGCRRRRTGSAPQIALEAARRLYPTIAPTDEEPAAGLARRGRGERTLCRETQGGGRAGAPHPAGRSALR